jgi:Na+-transporting NADH:ubiquinone oxidoreductase subunit NqrC
MSTLRINNARQASSEALGLRLVTSAREQIATRRFNAPLIAVLGLIAIQVLSVVIGTFISQSAYRLVDIKNQQEELAISADILSSQVDSLSSMQNLANAAHGLGMVANTNPVFLRLSDDKVIGKPKAAYASNGHVSSNLVPNSMLVTKTNVSAIQAKAIAAREAAAAKAAKAASVSATTQFKVVAQSVKTNVAKPVSAAPKVSSSSGLMASPTH